MEMQRWAVLLLVFAVVVGSARASWFAWRRTPRPLAWRVAVLLLLQLASAALLYRTLFPPAIKTGSETLVVATALAPSDLGTTLTANERLVSLPEAGATASAEPVPDLATALRRHPDTARLRIVGRGLTARDRDSVPGLPFDFVAAPLPRGLIELPASLRAQSGADFAVKGRMHGVASGHVELLDPAGQRIDRQPLSADGRFVLTGATRTAGFAEFRVRVIDTQGETVEEAALPVDVFAPTPMRVLVLAGAPDAEVKYLRRWGLDSGVRMTAQIQLGAGLQLGDAPIALNAATLKNFDAVVTDERAWDALGEARRRVLLDGVRNGLGLLLRIDGAPPANVRNALAVSGLRMASDGSPATFKLPEQDGDEFAAARLGPGSADAPTAIATDRLPELSRQPLRIDAQVWLRDDAGRALAAWRPLGRGRIAAWLPMDTFQLVLAGRDDLHAQLWSDAVAEVARPLARPALAVPTDGRQGTRMVLCGLKDGASVAALGEQADPLLIDQATGSARCAGYRPRRSGWHTLHDGAASAAFFVRDAQTLPGIAAREIHDATQRLALQPASSAGSMTTAPGRRWPWFLAWLLVSAVLWWLERSRLGRRRLV
ncbi:carboxypeptidase regulatory-like domain-containing protein [Lysobacter terrae]